MRWYENEGIDSDVVIMTTAVVSRSINGTPFVPKMKKQDFDHVKEEVDSAMKGLPMERLEGGNIDLTKMEQLMRDRVLMTEGAELSENSVIYTDEESSLNVFVNFSEHISVEARSAGFDLGVTDRAEKFASVLESKLDVSFSEKYGFLNSNLVDTGTGLRIFAMVCIPGICRNERGVEVVSKRCQQYDWKLAAPFKRAGAAGIFFILSDAMLGVSEKEMTENGRQLIREIIDLERRCRLEIAGGNTAMHEDLYARAYGTLKFATVQQPLEILTNLSNIRIFKNYLESDQAKVETEDLPFKISWKTINIITGEICRECMGDRPRNRAIPAANKKRARIVKEFLKGDD